MSNSTFGPSTASVVAAQSLMFFSLIAFPGSLCLPKPRRDKPRCMWKRPDATCSSTIALRTMQFSCDVCSRPAFPPHRARTFKTTTPPSTSVELATNKDSCDFLIRIFCQCRDFSKDISISHFELGVLELSAKFLPFLKSARDLRLTHVLSCHACLVLCPSWPSLSCHSPVLP